jgi:hypothetical protein
MNMKIHSFLILLLLGTDSILSVASFGSDFTFNPVWEQVIFSQRKIPAKLTSESEESLKKNGYVYIGVLDHTISLKTCWGGDCDKSFTCPDILDQNDSNDEINRKAASYGGDLIVWITRTVYTENVSKQGKCLRSEGYTTRESYTYYDSHGMQTGHKNVYHSRCVDYEYIDGRVCKFCRKVGVWRKQDSELSNLLKRDEIINSYIKRGRNNSSTLKPKSESEFIEFIAKFEEFDKYYVMKEWYEYNFHLKGKDTVANGLKSYSDLDEKFRKRFGYKDSTEKVTIEPQFLSARDFSEGLGCVSVDKGLKQAYGYIDKSAHWIISPSFDEAGNFQSGVACVTLNGKQGYIDKTGKLYMADEIREPVEATASQLKTEANQKSYNLALIEDDSEFFQAIANLDEEQKYVAVKKRNDDILNLSTDILKKKYWDTTLNISVFIKDKTGRLIIKPESVECRKVKCFWGFTDMNGNIVVEPKFDYCFGFSDGLAVAGLKIGKLKLKWGYIDKSGNWIIQPVYDDANIFIGGVARVRLKGKEEYIDKTGTLYGK